MVRYYLTPFYTSIFELLRIWFPSRFVRIERFLVTIILTIYNMKLTLRKYEVLVIRKLIKDRMDDLDRQGSDANQYRLVSLLDKRIMRQVETERRKNEKRLRNRS